jgi:hypothetical protein
LGIYCTLTKLLAAAPSPGNCAFGRPGYINVYTGCFYALFLTLP